jgi:hypothetical protein
MRHLRYLERERVSRVVINAHHRANDIKLFVDVYDGEFEYLGSEPFAYFTEM